MAGHGIFSAKRIDGSLHCWRIIKQIVVHQVTLISIAAPNPTISLNSINKKLARIQMQCVFGNIIDPIDQLIGAVKAAAIVQSSVLIQHVTESKLTEGSDSIFTKR